MSVARRGATTTPDLAEDTLNLAMARADPNSLPPDWVDVYFQNICPSIFSFLAEILDEFFVCSCSRMPFFLFMFLHQKECQQGNIHTQLMFMILWIRNLKWSTMYKHCVLFPYFAPCFQENLLPDLVQRNVNAYGPLILNLII